MSQKWRSSKKAKVDGVAFKRARLAAKNRDTSNMRGEYGHGSQEWLAEQARVSPRTINELEVGRATVKTVDAVSKVLGIQGRGCIQGYGEDFTTVRATGVVDFRPGINGRREGYETAYLNDSFLVTLDPVIITVDDDFIDISILQRMQLNLSVGDMTLDFAWLYNVRLTSRSSTWLGDEEDVSEVSIPNRKPYKSSVMFRQDTLKACSWKKFIDYIQKTDDSRVLLTLVLEFEYFKKECHIIVSVDEIKNLLNVSYPKNYPYWMQPKALMI